MTTARPAQAKSGPLVHWTAPMPVDPPAAEVAKAESFAGCMRQVLASTPSRSPLVPPKLLPRSIKGRTGDARLAAGPSGLTVGHSLKNSETDQNPITAVSSPVAFPDHLPAPTDEKPASQATVAVLPAFISTPPRMPASVPVPPDKGASGSAPQSGMLTTHPDARSENPPAPSLEILPGAVPERTNIEEAGSPVMRSSSAGEFNSSLPEGIINRPAAAQGAGNNGANSHLSETAAPLSFMDVSNLPNANANTEASTDENPAFQSAQGNRESDETRVSPKVEKPASEDGMADAQSGLMMKTGEKAGEMTNQTVQKMPTGILGDLLHRNDMEPVLEAVPDKPAASKGQRHAVTAFLPETAWSRDASCDFLANRPAPNRVSLSELQSQARPLKEIIWDQAFTMRRLNAVTTEVVLQPDSQTELRLQLQQRAGEIHVQARFTRGDAERFNAQWEQLQQALAPHGIRVAPLHEPMVVGSSHSDAPEVGSNCSSFQRDSKQPQPSLESLDSGADFALTGALCAAAKPSLSRTASGSAKRWESWA